MSDISADGGVKAVQAPDEVFVPVEFLDHVVQRGQAVAAGQLLARAGAPGLADAHSPIDGVVVEAGRSVLRVSAKAQPSAKAPDEPARDEPTGPLEALARLGKALAAPDKTELLVVNACEPEPGLGVSAATLRHMREDVEAGLESVLRALSPGRTVLAAPHGAEATLPGCETVRCDGSYPASLRPLVVKAVTGRENPCGVVCLSVMDLAEAGRVARTGKPLTDVVLEVEGGLYRLPVGAPVGLALDAAGVRVSPGDRVVIGGAWRGEAARNLETGVPKGTYAVTVVPKGAYPPVEDNDCAGCGECVRRCPARIDPCMISRYAEFGQHDKAAAEHAEVCFECGVCGYYCLSRRPLLQYIRLSKSKLELARREAL